MKMKIVAKNQNVLFDQVTADDAFEQAVEALEQPFQQVLRAARHLAHFPRRDLCKEDQAQRDDPRHDHGVGDRKAEEAADLDGFLRQAVLRWLEKT